MTISARRTLVFIILVGCVVSAASAQTDSSEIPAAFAPFEHLIGAWKGQGIPTANRVRGWPERHQWAWAFEKGKAVGLSIELTGNKILATGRITFDEKTKHYRLDGTTPEKEPVAFVGDLDKAKQVLTLERDKALAGGATQRLTLRLNSNKIRYTIWDDQKAVGAPVAKRITDMQMGKEGESLAGSKDNDKGPKCIVTGGAATMTVSAGGSSFPVCCTGCRDEVQENPEKYAKKLALRSGKSEKSDANKKSDADDDSFDALLGDSSKNKAKEERKP